MKQLKAQLLLKEQSLVDITNQLEKERDEKMLLLQEKEKEEKEKIEMRQIWQKENEELRQQISEMIELSKKEDIKTTRNRLMSEVDSDEIHQAYQKTIKDKDYLENENILLRGEVDRLTRMTAKPGDYVTHSRSLSNASSQNDEDFGYSSAKNTLDTKRIESEKLQGYRSGDVDKENEKHELSKTSTPKTDSNSQITLILRLRKILEDEKNKSAFLENQVQRMQNKTNLSVNNEDSLK